MWLLLLLGVCCKVNVELFLASIDFLFNIVSSDSSYEFLVGWLMLMKEGTELKFAISGLNDYSSCFI